MTGNLPAGSGCILRGAMPGLPDSDTTTCNRTFHYNNKFAIWYFFKNITAEKSVIQLTSKNND